jgi:hypothetical protein
MEGCSADRNTARIFGDFFFESPELNSGKLDFDPDNSPEAIYSDNKKHKDASQPKVGFRVFLLFWAGSSPAGLKPASERI